MKPLQKYLLALALFASAYVRATTYVGRSFFLPINQQTPAYDILDLEDKINRPNQDENYYVFKAQGGYGQSFNTSGVGKYLWFNGSTTMRFGATGADDVDVAGINFLLPGNTYRPSGNTLVNADGYSADLTINPRIQTG